MVGGGPGAFIGAVHRRAAALDSTMHLVAGAFARDADRSRAHGATLGLDPDRVYGSWEEMLERELARPASERTTCVSIVTPNATHYPIARAFLDAGFHVICDKPMTTTLEDAEDLCRRVAETQAVFAVTYNYSGYPMVKQARAMVEAGHLGVIRKVLVEYAQGWLATRLEATGQKQAAWRADPAQAGLSAALADIGSHAEHLVRYITGLETEALCADVSTLVEGRTLEDDANVLIHFRGGARGVLIASQISVGEANNLAVRIYGTDAGLEWRQERPDRLVVRYRDRPLEVLTRGSPWLSEAARHHTRLPPGHPEGFLEAFANCYVNAGRTMVHRAGGTAPHPFDLDFPDVRDGAIGVNFIHRALESGRRRAWVDADYRPPGA